jgi:hypothetical protein
MKTNGEQKWVVRSEWWVAGQGESADADTHGAAVGGRDETGTPSAEPYLRDYRIRYYLSSEKLRVRN